MTAASAQTTPKTPFDRTDVYCEKVPPLPGTRNTFNPGVTPNSITISDGSSDAAAQARLGFNVLDLHEALQFFVDYINNQCGGINGRKLILKKALFNSTAPDLTGHAQAQCIKATEDNKALFEIGSLGGTLLINRCVTVQHKIMLDSTLYPSQQDMIDSRGRLISIYPSADSVAATALAYGEQNNMFKGKKITVFAQASDPTQAGKTQTLYIDGLKKLGYDASLEMLPCNGAICTSGLGNAVRRAKLNGTDLIIMSQNWSFVNAGPLMAEFERQQLKARIFGPTNLTVNSDAIQVTLTAGAGAKGADWVANQMGWTAVGTEVTSAFRAGVKESPLARTCLNYYAKMKKQVPAKFNEVDYSNWTSATNACIRLRNWSEALWALGNNITTDRLVKAIHDIKPSTQMLKGGYEWERGFAFYQWPDRMSARKVTTTELRYPCPASNFNPPRTCFAPTNTPPRWFTVKV